MLPSETFLIQIIKARDLEGPIGSIRRTKSIVVISPIIVVDATSQCGGYEDDEDQE